MNVSNRRATAALVVLAVAAFGFVTTEVLPVGLLTVMAADLGRTRAEVGLLVSGYAVVVVLASLPLARLTRRVPRRAVLSVTLGVFAAGTLLCALADSYGVLLGARLVIALAQAMFWSVVTAAAAGMFRPEVRGRVVARLAIGNSIAPVFGIPVGTWLGQQAGWRFPFLVMAGLGAVTCATVTVLLPTVAPENAGAARGAEPDGRRYAVLMAVTALGVAGFITTFTYITPYLLDISGFAPSSLAPLLFAQGTAAVVGTVAIGSFVDRWPRGAVLLPLSFVAAALFGLYALGAAQMPTILMLALAGFAFSAMAPAIGSRTLYVAPGNTDMAAAGASTAFNVGIAAGSLLGAALISGVGTRSVALAGALLSGVAVAVALAEPWLARRRPRIYQNDAEPVGDGRHVQVVEIAPACSTR